MEIYISDKLPAEKLDIIKESFPDHKIIVKKNFFVNDNDFLLVPLNSYPFHRVDSFKESDDE